ncbi:MAG TPA: glycosyltransferase [Ktedonobacterales bacterium]|nr:glycosyltransferase [Ktedonobacterales bacterium]
MMAAQSQFNLHMRLFIWEDPKRAQLNQVPTTFAAPKFSFTVLLPARHEEAVIGRTIEQVCAANYPQELVEVFVICDASDAGTIATVRDKLSDPRASHVRLIIFADQPVNKPHALNKGLQAAQNDIVTIFDAEDEPHADIFNIINTTMMREDVEVVQGGVRLMNYATHWFSPLNVLEYYFWFKSALHYFGWSGIVPLGGNTVFVKRTLLKRLEGWDEHCLTEDADLGIRLSVDGARIRILCDDEHVTREETPDSIGALIRQRSRWHQGFLQVFLKGTWKKLPTFSQRALAVYVLTTPFIQGVFALMAPISIFMMVAVKLPVFVAVLTFVPLYGFGLQALIDMLGLVEFMQSHGDNISAKAIICAAIGYFPYQWLLAVAAVRAVLRQARHKTNWEKTAHLGVHRRIEEVA